MRNQPCQVCGSATHRTSDCRFARKAEAGLAREGKPFVVPPITPDPLAALAALLPFVLEEYEPTGAYATPAFREAVENAKAIVSKLDGPVMPLFTMLYDIATYAKSVRTDRLDATREYALQTVDWCEGLLEKVEAARACLMTFTKDLK